MKNVSRALRARGLGNHRSGLTRAFFSAPIQAVAGIDAILRATQERSAQRCALLGNQSDLAPSFTLGIRENCMNLFSKFALCIALAIVCVPAHAGLWSMSNAVVARGGSATISVTFTGDGITTDTEWDILLPHPRLGYSFTATSRGLGLCNIQQRTDGRWMIRVINMGGTLLPEPVAPQEFCEIGITVASWGRFVSSGWIFSTADVECADATPPYFNSCVVDPAYVTVAAAP